MTDLVTVNMWLSPLYFSEVHLGCRQSISLGQTDFSEVHFSEVEWGEAVAVAGDVYARITCRMCHVYALPVKLLIEKTFRRVLTDKRSSAIFRKQF